MKDSGKSAGQEKEVLRVALDKSAAHAFGAMADKLRASNKYIKVQPSQFVSFLVADFYATYFEKDLEMLVAQFFDSQAYIQAQTKRHKGDADYEDQMAVAISEAQRIRARRNRSVSNKKLRQKTIDAKQSKEP